MERRSRKERRFSCIEFSAKSESIMAEAIELSGTNPEARPGEKLGPLVQLLLHHAKCKLQPSRSLSLSLQCLQMWARENTVAVSTFRAPPLFQYPIFENLNDFRLYKSWRQLIYFFGFFRGEISQSFGLKISKNKYSFVIFCLQRRKKSTIVLGNEFSDKISFCYISSIYQRFGFCDIVTLATIHKKD